MKKILALVLAVVMTMGLASVAFAATGDLTFANGIFTVSAGVVKNPFTGGKQGTTLYIPLVVETAGGSAFANAQNVPVSTMNKWNLNLALEVGSDLVSGCDIVLKKAKVGDMADEAYIWVAEIKTNAASNTKMDDLVGTLKVYQKSIKKATDSLPLNFKTLGVKAKGLKSGEGNYGGVIPSTTSDVVVSFAECGEETIMFNGVGEMEINLANQGNLFLGFNTTFNSEFGALYDSANLEFVNFIGKPAFNKWGLFYLYGDEDMYVYSIDANGVLAEVDATYDEDYAAYKFAAKRLGTFILSDEALDVALYNGADAAVKENPSTGR